MGAPCRAVAGDSATRRDLTRGEGAADSDCVSRYGPATLVTPASRIFLDRASVTCVALLALAVQGCGDEPREEQAATKTEALATAEPSQPAATPAPPEAPARPKYPRPGFSLVKVQDKSPFCLFASEAERQLAPISATQAKKQNLRAGANIVVGAYPPWCVHETCDDRPSLQCWVDLKDNTLVLNTRYSGDHKDGTTCKDTCREIHAGCETPPLPAGKYTIQQGEQTWPLSIPSVLKNPCFVPES